MERFAFASFEISSASSVLKINQLILYDMSAIFFLNLGVAFTLIFLNRLVSLINFSIKCFSVKMLSSESR